MEITTKHILKLFWDHTKKYKYAAFGVFVFVALAQGVNVLIPLLYKRFFDVLTGDAGISSTLQVPTLIQTIFFILILQGIIWIAWRISGFSNIHLQSSVRRDLSATSFNYLIEHGYRFFTNTFTGSLVRKIKRLGHAYDEILGQLNYRLMPLVITVVGILIVLFERSVLLGGAILVWTALFLYINYRIALWKQPYAIERAKLDSETGAVLADSITNNTTVKLFAGYKHEQTLYAEAIERLKRLNVFVWKVDEWIIAVQGGLMVLIEFGVLYVAVKLWQQGILTVGDFALIQAYLITLFNHVWGFGNVLRRLYDGFADAKEMVEILDEPHEVQDKHNAQPLVVEKGEVVFDTVNFSFNETRRVLTDFSLEIEPGEKVAFVGPSGAGKSTLTKLLFRFYDVESGKILVDGQDVASVTQESLRTHIALVPQEPILFHRSLMENIRYGRRDASDEEVIEAAKKARCHDFIARLPERYETFVGERGVKLSGGERQRVAIARAILKDAPILVLDEATSSLDSESEALIQEALGELMHGRTSIIIAHRLSTIMQADRIIVIDGGKVSTMGTHEELMQKEGIYKTLWSIQAGGFLK